MRVSDIMNKAVVINSDINIKQAAAIMSVKKIGCLTFLKRGKIEGIVTERDILKNVSNPRRKVSSVMTRDVVVVDANVTLEKVIAIMARHKIKKILVVENEKLIGIVTSTDIISHTDLLHEDMFF